VRIKTQTKCPRSFTLWSASRRNGIPQIDSAKPTAGVAADGQPHSHLSVYKKRKLLLRHCPMSEHSIVSPLIARIVQEY